MKRIIRVYTPGISQQNVQEFDPFHWDKECMLGMG
jgi:hypothetical protein